MLTHSLIRQWVNNSAYYARGRSYAEEGRVLDIEEEPYAGGTQYIGVVEGSGRDYCVNFVHADDELLECGCSCPAFERTGEMCKHVAALMIVACDNQKAAEKAQKPKALSGWMQKLESWQRRQLEEIERQRAQLEREQQQSAIDEALFQRKLRVEDGLRRRHDRGGDVHLYPALTFGDGEISLSLKVGRTRPYVVRSMAEFVRASLKRTRHYYGKELTFSHCEEELVPEDVTLFRAIIGAAEGSQELNGPSIALYGAQLDAVMRALIGRSVEARANGGESLRTDVVEGAGRIVCALEPRGRLTHMCLSAQGAAGVSGAYFFCPEEAQIRCAFGERFDAVSPLLRLMARCPNGVSLEEDAFAQVCSRLLVPAGAAIDVTAGRDMLLEHTPMAMRPRFLIDMEQDDAGQRLVCRPEFDYGAATLGPGEDNPHIRRDIPGEEASVAAAKFLFPAEREDGCLVFDGKEEEMFSLLAEKLPLLEQDGEVMISKRLAQIHVKGRKAIQFGLADTGVELLLSADLAGYTQEDLMDAYAAYRQKRAYVRLRSGVFLSGEALEQAAQTAQMMQTLDVTADELAQGADVPLTRAMYLEAALRERESLKLDAPDTIRDFVDRLQVAQQVKAEPPTGLRATLRSYQQTGYGWLCALCETGFGGILADDMGLGKTLQALAMLLGAKEKGETVRALVVCPASLQLNWLAEAQKFAPGLTCAVLTGAAAKRREVIAAKNAPDVLITSYDQIRRDAQAYRGQAFTHMLLDEAQNIKNAASQGAKAVKTIEAQHRFAMTGTPIENRLSELWSIFDFLMPGYLLSYKKFRERFEAPIVQENDEDARRSLQLLTTPFILRRMKKDVLTDLPEKVETVLRSEMTSEQHRLYAAHAAKISGLLDGGEQQKKRMEILAGLTRLRQLCCDPSLCVENYGGGSGKLAQCIELATDSVAAGHSILLFSQFTSMLAILQKQLLAQGLNVFLLTGDTPKEERMELVKRFNAGEAQVFLISLKAGGTGLNLTGADVVIHYDPWWNTAAQNQATDRAYRIGQTRGVQVIRLIASDSIEERILLLQEKKRELSDGVLEGGEELGALDERTMRELLS